MTPPPIPTNDAVLVGRSGELARLVEMTSNAATYESPQVICINGEKGIGKSRLIEAYRGRIGDLIAEDRCLLCCAQDGDAPYAMLRRLLDSWLHLPASDPARAEQILRQRLSELVQDARVAEMVEFLGSFLDLHVRKNPFLQTLHEVPELHQQLARVMLRRYIELEVGVAPTVLIFEDLQLADDDSMTFLQELAESIDGVPVIIVFCFRPQLLLRRPQFGALKGEFQRLDLAPLPADQTRSLFDQWMGTQSVDFPVALYDVVEEVTGGNPALISQLVAQLKQDETVYLSPQQIWQVRSDRIDDIQLPLSVEEAVKARIAVLSPEERDVLEKAATVGSVFWLGAIVSMVRFEHEQGAVQDHWMADVVVQLVRQILLRLEEKDYLLRLPDASVAGDVEFAFKHNLERELVHGMVEQGRRQRYHRFAAQWLETRFVVRNEEQLELVAEHYRDGGSATKAALYFQQAAEFARKRFAHEKAVYFYRQAVELSQADDAVNRVELLHNLGDELVLLGDLDTALQCFGAMLRLSWLLDHKGKGGAAHRRIGRLFRTRGEWDRAQLHFDVAVRLFAASQDEKGVAATFDDWGELAFARGEYEQAQRYHHEALTIKLRYGDVRSMAVSRYHLGRAHHMAGDLVGALNYHQQALENRRSVEDVRGVVESLIQLGQVHHDHSDFGLALDVWNEALRVVREIADKSSEIQLLTCLGEALYQLGRVDDAQGRVNEAIALATDSSDLPQKTASLRLMAKIRAASANDFDGAFQAAHQAFELATSLQVKPQLAASLRTLGEVEAMRQQVDQHAKVAELFEQAIMLYEEIGARREVSKTYAILADYYDRCGEWKKADRARRRSTDAISDSV